MLKTFEHFTIANDFSVLFLFGKVVSVNLFRKVESWKADTQFNIFVLNRPMRSVGFVQTKKRNKKWRWNNFNSNDVLKIVGGALKTCDKGKASQIDYLIRVFFFCFGKICRLNLALGSFEDGPFDVIRVLVLNKCQSEKP